MTLHFRANSSPGTANLLSALRQGAADGMLQFDVLLVREDRVQVANWQGGGPCLALSPLPCGQEERRAPAGKSRKKVLPFPSSLSTPSWPPWASTMSRVTYRPSPSPSCRPAVLARK